MAGGGVGEAMLIGAAVGAGTGGIMSAAQDKDPLEGALLGAAMGAAGGGIGSAAGGALSGAATGASTGAATGTAGGVAGGVEGGVAGGTAGAGAGATGGSLPMGMTSTLGSAYGSSAGLGSSVVPSAYSTAGSGLAAGTSAGAPTIAAGSAGATGGATGTAAPAWGAQGLGQGFAPSLTNAQAYGAGAGGGIMGLIGNSQNQGEQWAPEQEPYTGSLSYFKYNPQTFKPSVAPGYAEGGVADLGNMYPQSQIRDRMQFSTPSQMPTSQEVINADYDTRVNPYTGEMPRYASGGISSLGSYSDGGRMLRGPGDGMSDDIPGVIAGKQPARLADGEFVVPADVVSHLGNGSTDAGAKKLYSMMDSVRKARTGSKKQGKQIKAEKHMPGMKSGGIAYYDEGGDTSSSEPAATKADVEAAINAARGTPAGMSTGFQASGYEPSAAQYTPYTMANRPSSNAPQYYQDIYQPKYQDFSAPDYMLAGNLGRWSNVSELNPTQYLALNRDVAANEKYGTNPFQHYIDFGMAEGRPREFDAAAYLQQNPDVAASAAYGQNPFQHYMDWGRKEGRSPTGPSGIDVLSGVQSTPSVGFNARDYLAQNPDVRAAGADPFQHYIDYGMQEGRQGFEQSPQAFNASNYLAQNPDVAKSEMYGNNPYQHYLDYGKKEGRKPYKSGGITSLMKGKA